MPPSLLPLLHTHTHTHLDIPDETDVFDPSACTGRFSTTCDAQGVCDYSATWTRRGDFVDFEVSARVELGRWVGIGFSDDRMMVRAYSLIYIYIAAPSLNSCMCVCAAGIQNLYRQNPSYIKQP